MTLVDNSRFHSVPRQLFLFLWFPSRCVSRPGFRLYPFFPTLPTLRASIYGLHGWAQDLLPIDELQVSATMRTYQ